MSSNSSNSTIPDEDWNYNVKFNIKPITISDFTLTLTNKEGKNYIITKDNFNINNDLLTSQSTYSITGFSIYTKDAYKQKYITTNHIKNNDETIKEVNITFTDPCERKLYGYKTNNNPSSDPQKVYINSTALIPGMTIYDNKGNITEYVVSNVYQNGSFDIATYTPVYCYKDSNLNQYYIFNSTPTVGDNVYNETGDLEGTIINVNETTIFFNSLNNTSNELSAIYYSVGNNTAFLLPNNKIILKKYNFTINPNPIDSTIVFNNIVSGIVSGNSVLKVLPGKSINYHVSREEYSSISNSYIMTNQDHIENVNLTYNMFTLTINPTPSDSIVILTASGYTQQGNSITVPYGTKVSCSVSREHYISYEETNREVTESTTANISLTPVNYTLTINPNPSDATVTFNTPGTVNGNIITVPYNTVVNYTVSKSGLNSISESETVIDNTTKNITLTYQIILHCDGKEWDEHESHEVLGNKVNVVYKWRYPPFQIYKDNTLIYDGVKPNNTFSIAGILPGNSYRITQTRKYVDWNDSGSIKWATVDFATGTLPSNELTVNVNITTDHNNGSAMSTQYENQASYVIYITT